MNENRDNQEVNNNDDGILNDPPHVPLNDKDHPPFIQKQNGIPSWLVAVIVGTVLLGIVILVVSTMHGSGTEDIIDDDDFVVVDDSSEDSVSEEVEIRRLDVEKIVDTEYTAEDTKASEFNGSIDEKGETDEYTFVAETDGKYGLFFHDIRNGLTFSVAVKDNLGNIVERGTSSGSSYTCIAELSAGIQYVIQVSGYWYDTVGEYYLKVYEPKKSADISNYTIVRDSSSFDYQTNSYSFTAKESGTYVFQFADLVAGMGIDCEVIDKLGYKIERSSLSNNGLLKVKFDSGETYTIKVTPDGSVGPYTMKIGQKKPRVDVSSYDVVMDCMQYKYQIINYTFTPTETGKYRFTTSEMMNGMEMSGRIIDGAGYEQGSNRSMSSEDYFTAQLIAGSTYDIVLNQDSDLGNYELWIEYLG